MQPNKDLLDKNHPSTILNMYGSEVKTQELFDSLRDYNSEDFIKSKLQSISSNIIHEIDSKLTQQYLENIDYSKYIVFK